MTEEFFNKILNFGDEWIVEKVTFEETTKEIDIFLRFDLERYKNNNVTTYNGIHDYRKYRRWRHLDILQYKTFIKARIPRVKDKDGKVKSVPVYWAEEKERHTYLFEKRVIDELLATKNQTNTSEILDCGFNVVNRIIHLASKRGLERRNKDHTYTQLSIDEKAYKKGHHYVTVLSSPEKGIIIDITDNRTTESCIMVIENNINEYQKKQIKSVSMDMWKPYIKAVEETLPNSNIVHDKFHLIKYLNEAVDNVRRRESKQYEHLKNSRYPLLKNISNLTEKQYFKFEEVLRKNTIVSLAWRLKECFKDLFNAKDYYDAFNRYNDWTSFCIFERIPEIMKVVKMFSNHIKGVCNALVENLTNAMAERLNGKIQELKTIGRGYRTFANFRSALLFFNGGLELYPHNSQ
jgi:transposase